LQQYNNAHNEKLTDQKTQELELKIWAPVASYKINLRVKLCSARRGIFCTSASIESSQGWIRLPNGRALTGFAHEYKRHGTIC
jgi:hypothetical protein